MFWGWALSCLVGAAALLLLLTFGGCRLGFAVWDLLIDALVLGLGAEGCMLLALASGLEALGFRD